MLPSVLKARLLPIILTLSYCPTALTLRAAGSKLPQWSTRNLHTSQNIYNLTVYPNNKPMLENGAAAVPPGLFNNEATGRVSPIGNFSGFDDSIEYFIALAPAPQNDPGVAFYAAEVVEFTSGCPDVAASVVYQRTGTVDPVTAELDKSKPTSTLTQIAFWKFDSSGAVLRYAAWIAATTGIEFSNVVVDHAAPAALCPVIQQRCTGGNRQYFDTLTCNTALQLKPFGSSDEAWGDDIVCRAIHLVLTQVGPEVHCPHVGPKGGEAPDNYECVDIDYSEEYFDDAALFAPPLGAVFTCGGPLLPE
ncbi:hypothetical protein LTR09_007682 [Extremus antarcticus]|uniref:Uncharacterized protein n=1 Tax=Extremus antarcticus TaxID=702011 RepID=A0AAJ0DIY6_9PEZI|nr:hypothetical protein LTR09_007682 [Extremus antarcticus]